jgi:haloalkane dehalogenase
MDVLRTPDERFRDLPGFPWSPAYATTADGLRVAYLDEGTAGAPVVVLLHGEPTWSFLWRKVVPPLLEAGLRVVAPDLVGFGRSDKPSQVGDYSYDRHVTWLTDVLFGALDLTGITLVCQDWGGLLGLRVVGEHPDRFAGVVTANTGLPDGTYRLPEPWWRFRDFVARTDDLPIGFLVDSGCLTELAPAVVAAYEAPFPAQDYKAAAKAFPDLIPQSLDDPAAPAVQAAWEVLEGFDKPWLNAFSDGDPITRGADALFTALVPGTAGQPHTTIEGAGHFLQEDRGEELGAVVVSWLRGRGVVQ